MKDAEGQSPQSSNQSEEIILSASPNPPPLPTENEVSREELVGPSTVQEGSETEAPVVKNYFSRHWHGELPLVISYWVNGIGVSLCGRFLESMLSEQGDRLSLRASSLLMFCLYAGGIATGIWQAVGIWRSASKHVRRGGEAKWASIAKFIVFLNCVNLIYRSTHTLIPQTVEFGRIALGDSGIPAYSITVLPSRNEIEFRGGIRAGCAKDFKQMLEANPQVKVVHLNSGGGRQREAAEMAKLVRERKLITYTQDHCLSAATIVFLAGKERVCHVNAKIGFHRGTHPGMTTEQDNFQKKEILEEFRTLGISEHFAWRVSHTPPTQMWYPTFDEMREAGVITSRSFGDRFSVSGEMLLQSSTQKVDQAWSSIPIYKKLKQLEPALYAEMIGEFSKAVQQGSTEGEATAKARARIGTVGSKYILKTSDRALRSMRDAWVDLIGALKDDEQSSVICISIIAPHLTDRAGNYSTLVPGQVRTNLLNSLEIMFSEAGESNNPVNVEAAIEDLETVMAKLQPVFGEKLELLSDESAWMKNSKIVSEMFFGLYRETQNIPVDRQANLLRHMLSGSAERN